MDRYRPKWHLGTLYSIQVINFCQITSSISGNDPTYCTIGTGALSGGKVAGACRWPPTQSSGGVKERVEPYQSPSPVPGPHVMVYGELYILVRETAWKNRHVLYSAYLLKANNVWNGYRNGWNKGLRVGLAPS